jgi:Domain of unknown function (DUF4234)
MTKRSPVTVLLLTLVTCGIYGVVWYVQTKEEMVARGADIPTAWLLIIPFVSFYWMWKWCEGAQLVTKGETSTVSLFLLLLCCGIGIPMAQSAFNKVA